MELKDSPAMFLTDEEIHEEAVRRASSMDPSERKLLEDDINHYFDLLELSREKGFDHLTKEEKKAYYEAAGKSMRNGTPDLEYAALERHLTVTRGLSRKEIAEAKGNPFLLRFFIWLGITVLVGAGGVLAVALIEKASGLELKWAYLVISTASGLLALRTANELMTLFRFRKFQRALRKGEYPEQLVKAEVYQVIKEEVKEKRGITE